MILQGWQWWQHMLAVALSTCYSQHAVVALLLLLLLLLVGPGVSGRYVHYLNFLQGLEQLVMAAHDAQVSQRAMGVLFPVRPALARALAASMLQPTFQVKLMALC